MGVPNPEPAAWPWRAGLGEGPCPTQGRRGYQAWGGRRTLLSTQGPCSKPVSPCLAGGVGLREKVPANPEALLLMASSQRDMEDWVQAIRRVIWAPLGGGTARRSHAHPLEPLPSGNHAPPPCMEPVWPLSLRAHCLCPERWQRVDHAHFPGCQPSGITPPGYQVGSSRGIKTCPPPTRVLGCVRARLPASRPCWVGVRDVVCTRYGALPSAVPHCSHTGPWRCPHSLHPLPDLRAALAICSLTPLLKPRIGCLRCTQSYSRH